MYAELADLQGGEPLPALEDHAIPPATPPRNPFIVGLAILAGLVVVSLALFQLLAREPAEGPRPPSTTVAVGTDDGTNPTDETTPATDDTSTGDTTVVTETTTLPPIEPLGDPIPLEELQLARRSIGTLEFGTPADQVLGRLVASLGPPDADSGDTVSTGAFGSCLDVYERIVRWGPLHVIVNEDAAGVPVFAGYRLDTSESFISPASDLATLSGLKAGNSIAELEAIYAESFALEYSEDAGVGPIFEMTRTSDGALVLWGPITSSGADGIVLGIFSPPPCSL